MIQINTSLYQEIHNQKPRLYKLATWIFEDMEGLWRHTGYGEYEDILEEARASYRRHFQTHYGQIQVLP